MKRINLTGQTFGDWEALEYIGDKHYICKCKCGLEVTMSAQVLKRKTGTKCTHIDNSSKLKYDLTGQKFGEWTVLEYVGNQRWKCRCSCGIESDILSQHLRLGRTKSCGHESTKFKNLLEAPYNGKFGEWTVLEYAGNQKWHCRCSCGNVATVNRYDLISGKSKSCGHDTVKFKDLTLYPDGSFGDWKVLKYLGNQMYLCRCSCGKEREVDGRSLRSGASKSCGHKEYLDLSNQKFGEWTALKYEGNHKWLCQCSCGTYRLIPSQRLRSGITLSCGCKQSENYLKTVRNKYGIDNISQRHLSKDQLNMTSSKDNLGRVINSLDNPTPINLSEVLGITPCQVMRVVRKYNLEAKVILNSNVSSYEDELNKLFPCDNRSNRNVLNGKELDLYYPEQNLAIEFNGSYWHGEFKKPIKYHQNKSIEAGKHGIQIIHIFEYEWNNLETRDKIINLIDRKLNPEKLTPLHAKDCNIKVIDNKVACQFLDIYHLQSSIPASINLGCFYNDRLIGVMTFGSPRFNNNYEYELIRMAWDNKYAVSGGSNKLLQYFINNYNPKSIISYCDISKFDGNSYLKLGFKCNGITQPNYKWVSYDGKMLTRYQTQKAKLIELNLGDKSQTESEIMHNIGFYKVYDCGNLVFTWNKELQDKETAK